MMWEIAVFWSLFLTACIVAFVQTLISWLPKVPVYAFWGDNHDR